MSSKNNFSFTKEELQEMLEDGSRLDMIAKEKDIYYICELLEYFKKITNKKAPFGLAMDKRLNKLKKDGKEYMIKYKQLCYYIQNGEIPEPQKKEKPNATVSNIGDRFSINVGNLKNRVIDTYDYSKIIKREDYDTEEAFIKGMNKNKLQKSEYLLEKYFNNESIVELINNIILNPSLNNIHKQNEINKVLIPMGFKFLGTGTNRTTFIKHGLVFKMALDVFGIIDNKVEYTVYQYESYLNDIVKAGAKPTKKNKSYIKDLYPVHAIEKQGVIAVGEYRTVCTEEQFIESEERILEICEGLSSRYYISDIGFNNNNFKNYGFIPSKLRGGGMGLQSLQCIDYGYLMPKTMVNPRCTRMGCPGVYEYFDERTGKTDFYNLHCELCGHEILPFDIFENKNAHFPLKHNLVGEEESDDIGDIELDYEILKFDTDDDDKKSKKVEHTYNSIDVDIYKLFVDGHSIEYVFEKYIPLASQLNK